MCVGLWGWGGGGEDDPLMAFMGRKTFLFQKSRTIDPDGLNIREETYYLFPFIMLFHYFILP